MRLITFNKKCKYSNDRPYTNTFYYLTENGSRAIKRARFMAVAKCRWCLAQRKLLFLGMIFA